ncbi:MAG: ATP-binding protein [Pseudomonadota bacterium]
MSAVWSWLLRRRPWPKRLWPRSLRGRLIALLLAALVLAQMVAAILFFDERRMAVRLALAEESMARTAQMAVLLRGLEPDLRRAALRAASTRRTQFRETRAAPRLRGPDELDRRPREADWLRAQLVSALEDLAPEVSDWDRRAQISLTRTRWRGGPPGPGRGRPGGRRGPSWALTAAVALETDRWLTLETRFRPAPLRAGWPALVAMGLTALAIIVIVSFSVGRLTRPLRDLAEAAERFGRGAGGAPVRERGPEEARRLIATFNGMQERITRFVSDRTRMLASISHDLRTPLTSMRIRAELVEDAETRDKLIEGLDEMHRMVEATLAFAREDAETEPTRPIDLASLAESVVEDFQEMGAAATFAPAPRAVVACRPEAVKRALRNLIENALRYGGRADVSVAISGEMVAIRVDDAGPGVAPDDIEGLFEPFARGEASRNRETGGAGLGLSIARSIARGHGCEVTLENRAAGGLRARLALPLSAEA